MTAIAGYNSAIYFATNASSVSLPADDVLTDSGDHTTYTEATAMHRYWDDSAVPVVQTSPDGTTWTTQSATLYTVQYVGGKVIWNSAQASGTQTRIHSGGKYFAYQTYALGTDWDLAGTTMMADSTVFGGGRGKTYVPTLFTGVFSMKAFWIDNTFLANITSGFRLIFSGSPDATHRYESYAFTKTDKIHAPVAGLVDEQMSFQVTGNWYYN